MDVRADLCHVFDAISFLVYRAHIPHRGGDLGGIQTVVALPTREGPRIRIQLLHVVVELRGLRELVSHQGWLVPGLPAHKRTGKRKTTTWQFNHYKWWLEIEAQNYARDYDIQKSADAKLRAGGLSALCCTRPQC